MRELRRDARQALHRNADAAVVQRAGPAGSARDVAESLLRIEDDADLLWRREIELRFEIAEVVFQRVQDGVSEFWRRAAVILQLEVRRLAFAVAFFFILIALRFFERSL